MPESMVSVAEYTMIVTGILIAIGGIIGFIKARSMPSLLSGVVSGLLLVGCFIIANQHDTKIGLGAGILLLTMLEGVFAVRFAKTRKMMPSGMLIGVCVISQLIVIAGELKAFDLI